MQIFGCRTSFIIFFYCGHELIVWNTDWTPRMHYVNIATPAVWDLTEVIYIDLDPDVLRKYGSEKIIIADEYEFEQHKIEYNYPKNLIHTTIGNNIVVFKRK